MTPAGAQAGEPQASVIVPVRNALRDLPGLLEALARQTLPRDRFEVIIADDGSAEPPTRFATPDGHVRVLAGPATNAYGARNRGVASSQGEILAFCDADCVPEEHWLAEGIAALERAEVAAGRVRFTPPGRRTVWTLIDMDTSKNQAALVDRGVAETANLFVRRREFDLVGGFDASVSAYSDYEFVERCVAAGARLVYARDAVVSHPTRQRGRDVLKTQWVYSRAYAEQAAMHRRPVNGLRLREWVPVVGTIRSRRRAGVALTPATAWIAENGVRPSWPERVLALPLMYLVLPYTRNTAMVVGAVRGNRTRAASGSPPA
jgi:glycosyltransferase involved in cell wall biosynthesis